ncbi:hypothetical protein ABB02_00798 [Clostridiaceae bacterium JG1575]|nr:hypothetical protein ABB02_00798 [Clostridiaceae bacterium JG1575]
MLNQRWVLAPGGLLWMTAGTMVVLKGLPHTHLYSLPFALMVFFLFYEFIFSKLVKHHTARVQILPDGQPFWRCFDGKSWLIMAVMMTSGLLLGPHFPSQVLGFFYPGLGAALFSCGLRLNVRCLHWSKYKERIS